MKIQRMLPVLVMATGFLSAQIASDQASNYGTWTDASNAGSGFQAWEFASSDGGHFLGSAVTQGLNNGPLDTSGQSFGMWATGFSTATRSLVSPLNVGEAFSFSIAYQFDNGNRGFNLNSGATQIFNFNINDAGYTWTGGGSEAPTPWTGIRENGVLIHFDFTRTALGYDFNISSAQDANLDVASSIIDPTAVDRFQFYVSGAGGGPGGDYFFNNLQIIPEPGTALLLLGGVGVLAFLKRRRG